MRFAPIAAGFALLTLGGCKSVEGWWDLVSWKVEGDGGEPLRKQDAGFMIWQESTDLGFHLQLRYRFDPVGWTLEPIFDVDDQEVGVFPDTWSGYPDKDEPLMLMYIPTTLGYDDQVDLFIDQFRNGRMVLVSEPTVDGTVYTWTMVR